ncbi:hypothetical protein [Nocardia sp. NPDC004604]
MRPHLKLEDAKLTEIAEGFGYADNVKTLAMEVARIERDEWKLI